MKPDWKFVFTPEQFATHHTKGGLGHEYTVWIRDAAGGPRKEISLIARFVPKTGKMVVSEQSRHLLPGENVVANSAGGSQTQPGFAEAGVNSVRLTSYQYGSARGRGYPPIQNGHHHHSHAPGIRAGICPRAERLRGLTALHRRRPPLRRAPACRRGHHRIRRMGYRFTGLLSAGVTTGAAGGQASPLRCCRSSSQGQQIFHLPDRGI